MFTFTAIMNCCSSLTNMATNGNSSSKRGAVLSDAHLIRIMHTFFELTDWTMSCNDMLTKVFHAINGSIAKGRFEDTLRGFMAYLMDKGDKKYRRNSKDMTYLEFQVMIAGLIKRFANSRTLREVIDGDKDSISSHCTTMVYNMQLNSNTLSLIDTSPYSGVKLVTAERSTVMSPKQGAILVFLFTKYYSHSSIIENTAVCSFLEILEQIDEAMFGSVEAGDQRMNSRSLTADTSINDHLLSTYGGKDQVIDMYIKKEYRKIFETLNTCFLQYDFLNTDSNHSNKKLLENYVAAILSLQSKPDEFDIWTLEVTNLGEVRKIHELSTLDTDINIDFEKSGFIVLTSLMLLDPQSMKKEMTYKSQYILKANEIQRLLNEGLYSDKNPYDTTVTRTDGRNILRKKLDKLMSLHSRLNPSHK
ncbi:U23-like protein [Lissonota sp. PSUC_FEM 10030012]|nr:U23-like protein [Lissonota sp. PSUC_FEM 10030012]